VQEEVEEDEVVEEQDVGENVSEVESDSENEATEQTPADETEAQLVDGVESAEINVAQEEPEREPSEDSEVYEELFDPALWEQETYASELEKQIEILDRKQRERIQAYVPDRSEVEKFLEWDNERLSYRAVDIIVHLGARAGPLGSTIKLTCSATGPAYTVTWLKDRQPLKKSYQILTDDEFQTLVITNAKAEDCGMYTCVFNNKGGKRTTSGMVRVYGVVDEKPSQPIISLMNGKYFS
jgi:hypothetical protein